MARRITHKQIAAIVRTCRHFDTVQLSATEVAVLALADAMRRFSAAIGVDATVDALEAIDAAEVALDAAIDRDERVTSRTVAAL